jgi:predicted GIY-YIG superfamily endonuclease
LTQLATTLSRDMLLGWYVYKLRNAEGEVIYVGRSGNICARLGSHVRDTRWGADVDAVDVERVADELAAHDRESALIEEFQPKHNQHGRNGHAVRRPGTCCHLLRRDGTCSEDCRYQARTFGGPGYPH